MYFKLAHPLACSTWLHASRTAQIRLEGSSPRMRGFVVSTSQEHMPQETPMQGSFRRKAERKICTGCKVEKPASEFRAHWNSRDGLEHFCILCKVVEAEALDMVAPSTSVTANEAVCSRCKQLKPAAEFCRNPKAKNGLRSWCKACNEAYNKQWRKKVLSLPPDRSGSVEYKLCARCHIVKLPEDFHRQNSSLDGLNSSCRQCKKEIMHLSYQRTPAAPTLRPSGTKGCTKCGRELPTSSFSIVRHLVTGLNSWCKDCNKQAKLRRHQRTMQRSSRFAPLQIDKASCGL